MKHTLDKIIDLAQNVELGDGIDWEGLNVDRDRVYYIMASQVCEMFAQEDFANTDKEAIMLATIVKLIVENFVLNIKLESGDYYGKN